MYSPVLSILEDFLLYLCEFWRAKLYSDIIRKVLLLKLAPFFFLYIKKQYWKVLIYSLKKKSRFYWKVTISEDHEANKKCLLTDFAHKFVINLHYFQKLTVFLLASSLTGIFTKIKRFFPSVFWQNKRILSCKMRFCSFPFLNYTKKAHFSKSIQLTYCIFIELSF